MKKTILALSLFLALQMLLMPLLNVATGEESEGMFISQPETVGEPVKGEWEVSVAHNGSLLVIDDTGDGLVFPAAIEWIKVWNDEAWLIFEVTTVGDWPTEASGSWIWIALTSTQVTDWTSDWTNMIDKPGLFFVYTNYQYPYWLFTPMTWGSGGSPAETDWYSLIWDPASKTLTARISLASLGYAPGDALKFNVAGFQGSTEDGDSHPDYLDGFMSFWSTVGNPFYWGGQVSVLDTHGIPYTIEIEDLRSIDKTLLIEGEAVGNGGFETGASSNWVTGGYGDHEVTSEDSNSGSYSMLIGFKYEPNVAYASDYAYQTITIPAGATEAQFSFHYHLFTEDMVDYNWLEVYIRDATGTNLELVFKKGGIDYPGWEEYGWAQVTYDVAAYAGETIQLYFALVNWWDQAYRTYCYIDDVSVTYTVPCELGDTINVRIEALNPSEETLTVVDTIPKGLDYIDGTFTVDGVPASPTITKNGPPPPIITEISCTITESGGHVIEFDVKVDEAKSWEDTEVCNIVAATWFDNEDNVIETKEDVKCLIIHAFEELGKRIWLCTGSYADLTGVDIAYDQSHGERDYTWMSIIRSELTSRGATITVIPTGPITVSLLQDYDILWIDDWGWMPWTAAELDAVYAWVSNGGAVLLHANEIYSAVAVSRMFGMDQGSGGYNQGYSTNIVEHWITICMDAVYVPGRMSALVVSDPAYTIVYDAYDVPLVACAEVGDGRVAFIGDDLLWDANVHMADNDVLANRAFDWLAIEYTPPPGSLVTKVRTETQWAVVFEVTNTFSYTMKNVTIKDNFGAELEIDQVMTSPDTNYDGVIDIFDLVRVGSSYGLFAHLNLDEWDPVADINCDGVVDMRDLTTIVLNYGLTLWLTGNSHKVHLYWYIGDLDPGETAKMNIVVSTDLNPAGHQEYTEPGVYEMNSGATLKFIDPGQDVQLSAVTDSIYVTVLPEGS